MRVDLAGGPNKKRIVNVERLARNGPSAASTINVSAQYGWSTNHREIFFNHSLPENGVGAAMRIFSAESGGIENISFA